MVVETVGYVHTPGTVKCHIPRVIKLSITTAIAAKTARECQVFIQNLNSVILLITNVNFFVLVVDANANGTIKLQVSATFPTNYCEELSFWCKFLNAMALFICN